MHQEHNFGEMIRKQREEAKIGLRTMAKYLEVSPTYLSKVERGQEHPPTEKRIERIAELLNLDLDVLMAAAGRVPEELLDLYREKPNAVMALLRSHSVKFSKKD